MVEEKEEDSEDDGVRALPAFPELPLDDDDKERIVSNHLGQQPSLTREANKPMVRSSLALNMS